MDKKPDYKENTIYVRQRDDSWETFSKCLGRGRILSNVDSKENAIRLMTFILWAVNEFGPEKYGDEMAKLEGAPEGVSYPVIEEEPVV